MYKLLFLFFAFISLNSNAQSLIDSLTNPGFTMQDTIAEKLAIVAISNNPRLKAADKQIEADLYEWKRNKLNWLPNLTPSFNINEGNLRGKDTVIATFYPRYNLSLAIPISNFFSGPKAAKRAKAIYEGSQFVKEVEITNLKEQIKTAYQIYQANRYLVALQETVLRDEGILMKLAEQDFEKNKVTLEAFTLASKRYNAELVKKVNLLRDVNTSRNALEALLGMDLETALRMAGITTAQ